MKLLTKEIEKRFERYPLGSQEGLGTKAVVVAKFFNPCGAGTWIITEGDKCENGDYEMFGYCHLGSDEYAEFGYVMLSELQDYKGFLGLGIERDLNISENATLGEVMKSCGFPIPEWLAE